MRKIMMALFLAGFAAGPALADDDDRRKGKGKGQHKEFKQDRGDRDRERGRQWRGRDDDDDRGRDRRGGWARGSDDDDDRRVRVVRIDRDDWNDRARREVLHERRRDRRERIKEQRQDRREYRREARQDWREDRQRVVRYAPARLAYDRQVYAPARYARPAVRYVQQRAFYDDRRSGYAATLAPLLGGGWSSGYTDTGYDDPAGYDGYWPTNYSPLSAGYANTGGGLLGGGGNSILGALLPVVVQSLFGGGDSALGGLGGLGGLTGLGGGLSNGLDVLPLQQASYADPYGSGDLTSLLLPSLLGQGGSLF